MERLNLILNVMLIKQYLWKINFNKKFKKEKR